MLFPRLCDFIHWNMPRSFLVKKIKLDDFSSSNVASSNHHHHHLDDSFTFARSITDSVASLGVRLSENGEFACHWTAPLLPPGPAVV